MKKILELDSSNDQAKKAIRRLEPLAEQKREKMKEEMIGTQHYTVLKVFSVSYFIILCFRICFPTVQRLVTCMRSSRYFSMDVATR